MKKTALICALVCAFCFSASAQVARTSRDITKDEVKTLVGVKSESLSIMGLRLSMNEQEAADFLLKSENLMGERDSINSGRIYVYEKTRAGKGKALLYLIWDGQPTMRMITVFEDFKPYLKGNFQKLLTARAVNFKSPFVRKFIGAPNRSAVTLDVKSIGLHHTTYYFDKIGLELTKKKSNWKDDGVVFALVPSNPR